MTDALSEEFFAEVSDKYYPQVLEGLELLGAGEVQPGIEILARPLHTIKGVTGFMPGFESASAITHKVESFLKKLQASTLPHSADNISLAVYGVNSVFAVIEQIRDQGTPDQGEIDAVCAVLEAASAGGEKNAVAGSENCLRVEKSPEAARLVLTAPRVHRKAQRDQLTAAIIALPQELPIIIDVTGVLTFGTAAWEELASLTAYWGISVCGLSGATKETFYAADMDVRMPLAPPPAKEQAPA